MELRNEIPWNLPPVLADSNRLQQIFYNLVGNAIKFTHQGYVAVKATSSDGTIEIVVEDTGIGIPADKQEAIFRSFEQADGNTAREYGGTGLGLSITKQLVESHQGKIWVESTPGNGSRFCFTMPVSTEPTQLKWTNLAPIVANLQHPVLEEPRISIPLIGTSTDVIQVLVVDDEPINHQVLRNYLGDQRYLITSVMSGREALEVLSLIHI